MQPATAKRWLVISALVVAGVWGYRRMREGPGSVTELPKFITAWGAVYFTLSMVAEAAPGVGGSFAILVMTADLLTQGKQIIADVTGQEAGKPAAGGTGTTPSAGDGKMANRGANPGHPSGSSSASPRPSVVGHVSPVNRSGTPAHGGAF